MLQFAEMRVSENFLGDLRTKILAERNARIEASLNKGFSLNRIPSFAYGFVAALVAVIIGFYLLEFQTGSSPAQMPPRIVQEKIQQKTPDSENITVSLEHFDSQNAHTRPDFQNNIKTVKKEY